MEVLNVCEKRLRLRNYSERTIKTYSFYSRQFLKNILIRSRTFMFCVILLLLPHQRHRLKFLTRITNLLRVLPFVIYTKSYLDENKIVYTNEVILLASLFFDCFIVGIWNDFKCRCFA